MNFEQTFGKYDGKDTKEKLVNYIKANYQDILGSDVAILDEQDGLDRLKRKYFKI
jgi:hypothetical protein